MEIFDIENSVVSADDLHDGVDFVSEFSQELQSFSGRVTGSPDETACARTIRRRLGDETGATVRLEAYRAYPYAGRSSLFIYGLWYLLGYALYFVSFAGGGVAGILLTLFSLIVFAVGCTVMCISYFPKRKKPLGLFVKKVSYNVVSEFVKQRNDKEADNDSSERGRAPKTVIICDNHDLAAGSFFKDGQMMRVLAHIFVPLTAFVFVLFCILKMAIGADTPAKVTAFSVIPSVVGVIGITSTLLRFSPFEKHAEKSNGVATSAALATYAYFVEKPEFMPDGARLVYASLGGENSAHGGSLAFIKAHPEFKGASVLCIGDALGGNLKIAGRNAVKRIEYSTRLSSVVRSSAHEQKIEISAAPTDTLSQKLGSIHGYLSDSFAGNGFPTVTLFAEKEGDRVLERNDIEKLFSLAVGSVMKLLNDAPLASENETPDAPVGSEMEIKTAVGK